MMKAMNQHAAKTVSLLNCTVYKTILQMRGAVEGSASFPTNYASLVSSLHER